MRLVQHMYRNGSKLFGLSEGQMRGNDFVHNGSWYNDKGEKIGWGDLSVKDIINIALNLEENEQFYILPEGSSYWAFTKVNDDLSHTVSKDASAPGIDYVKSKARYLIESGKVMVFLDSWSAKDPRKNYHAESYQKIFGPTVKVTVAYHQELDA